MVIPPLKLWLDDLRDKPDESWTHCFNVPEAIAWIEFCVYCGVPFEEASLDNDLGEGWEEGRKLVLWFATHEVWPERIHIHSANPVAAEYMNGMIKRYKP